MPALDSATVWTGYLAPTSEPVPIGTVMIPDAAGQYVIPATLENRTAANRTTSAVGIALTGGDQNDPRVRVQTGGPCGTEITGLTNTGTSSLLRVSDQGRLERVDALSPGDVYAGRCDPDGYAYLRFEPPSASAPSSPYVLKFSGYLPGSPADSTNVFLADTGTSNGLPAFGDQSNNYVLPSAGTVTKFCVVLLQNNLNSEDGPIVVSVLMGDGEYTSVSDLEFTFLGNTVQSDTPMASFAAGTHLDVRVSNPANKLCAFSATVEISPSGG